MIKKKFLAIFALGLTLAIAPTGCASATTAKTTKTAQTTKIDDSKKVDGQKSKEEKISDNTAEDEDNEQKKIEETIGEVSSEGAEKASNSSSASENVATQNSSNSSSASNKNTTSSSTGTSTSSNGTNNSDSSSSSSSSSSSGTTKPSTPSTPQHTHSYTIPITETVSVPEKGHYETKTVQEAQYAWRTFCNRCKKDITDLGEDGITLHVLDCGGGYYNDYVKVKDAVTESVWVVDSAATTRTETVGWKCACGATK